MKKKNRSKMGLTAVLLITVVYHDHYDNEYLKNITVCTLHIYYLHNNEIFDAPNYRPRGAFNNCFGKVCCGSSKRIIKLESHG